MSVEWGIFGVLCTGGEYRQRGPCGSTPEWVWVWVANLIESLLPFPNSSIHVRQYKEAHMGISMGVC